MEGNGNDQIVVGGERQVLDQVGGQDGCQADVPPYLNRASTSTRGSAGGDRTPPGPGHPESGRVQTTVGAEVVRSRAGERKAAGRAEGSEPGNAWWQSQKATAAVRMRQAGQRGG